MLESLPNMVNREIQPDSDRLGLLRRYLDSIKKPKLNFPINGELTQLVIDLKEIGFMKRWSDGELEIQKQAIKGSNEVIGSSLGFKLYLGTRELLRPDGRVVHLSRTELGVLEVLMRNSGTIVPYFTFTKVFMPGNSLGRVDNSFMANLRTYVNYLRIKINDEHLENTTGRLNYKYISAIFDMGYMFSGEPIKDPLGEYVDLLRNLEIGEGGRLELESGESSGTHRAILITVARQAGVKIEFLNTDDSEVIFRVAYRLNIKSEKEASEIFADLV